MSKCPCGTNLDYSSCCEPYIKGSKKIISPEACMRARYSAFAKTEIDFLERSYHPTRRAEFNRGEVEQWSKASTWKGLEILNATCDEAEGTVEFIAHYSAADEDYEHHEVASFKKVDDSWFFLDGKLVNEPFKRGTPKVGRNDNCPCGSGKKYKKCCLK